MFCLTRRQFVWLCENAVAARRDYVPPFSAVYFNSETGMLKRRFMDGTETPEIDPPHCEPPQLMVVAGPNGSGKSSILKLLCGQDIPHTGTLELASGLVISYVPQDASGLRGSLRDYAARCGIDETLFKTILRKLGFERVQFEKDMSDYSAGQKKKVLLARSMCQSAHLYIWDEPLNYVDVLSRIQIEELLTAFRPTLLFVEHDRMFCDKIATKLVEL